MANEPTKRQIAHKVTIGDINEGRYVKEEGWEPNYVIISDGRKVSRVNLIAVIVSKTDDDAGYQGIMLDDGSGKINIRSFGSEIDFKPFNIGDLVLVVGRPREFNNDKYLVPEIIKKLDDKKWIEVRKLELQIARKNNVGSMFEKEPPIKNDFSEEVVEDSEVREGGLEIKPSKDTSFVEQDNAYQIILSMIKSMDKGDGVDVNDLYIKSKLDNAEEVVMNLLKEGEIFELRPGRVKILS